MHMKLPFEELSFSETTRKKLIWKLVHIIKIPVEVSEHH